MYNNDSHFFRHVEIKGVLSIRCVHRGCPTKINSFDIQAGYNPMCTKHSRNRFIGEIGARCLIRGCHGQVGIILKIGNSIFFPLCKKHAKNKKIMDKLIGMLCSTLKIHKTQIRVVVQPSTKHREQYITAYY